jgi:hypothetical protein
MHRHNNLPGRPSRTALRRRQGLRGSPELTCLTLLLAVTLFTCMCAITAGVVSQTASLVGAGASIGLGPKAVNPIPFTRTPLPTFTPTSLPTLTPVTGSLELAATPFPTPPVYAPALTSSPVLIAVQPNTATEEPTTSALAPAAAVSPAPISVPPNSDGSAATATLPLPSPTPAPAASGWTFSGVTDLVSDPEGGLLLMGELVNGTGAPQQAIAISGAFYDVQGEVAVDTLDVVSYVPVDPVPADAHIPFELLVSGSQDIDRFDLRALSEPASDAPRQDFQFSGVEQWLDDATGYCIRGQVDNQGPPPQEYLIVLAIGYDDQGSVVNFGEYYVDVPPEGGAQSSTFEMCLASLGRQISRHDLRAFGD